MAITIISNDATKGPVGTPNATIGVPEPKVPFHRRNPLRSAALLVPSAILTAASMLSLTISADQQLSLRKVIGLIIGVAVYLIVVELARTRNLLTIAWSLYVAAATAVAAVGLVTADWTLPKLPVLGNLWSVLPHVAIGDPGSEGLNPNELAGVLALMFPASVALGVTAFTQRASVRWGRLRALGVCGAAAFQALVLLLALSLSALGGTLIGLLAMAAVLLPRRARRNLLAVAGLVVAATCVAIADMRVGGPGANVVQELVLKYGGHLAVRAELWQRGLLILHDFPLTGIGINTLPLVLPVMYPLIISSGDPRPPPHVHNFLLQTGVDLGVPGVLALIWILGVTSRLLWGGWKAQQGSARLLALSLGAGLIAHLIFGLTDAVALGARPGFLLWWTFGLAEAVWVTRSSSR